MTNINKSEKENRYRKYLLETNFGLRLVLEFFFTYVLIATISFVFTFGQIKNADGSIMFPLLHTIYASPFLTGTWIASITIIAFIISKYLGMSVNLSNVVTQYKKNEIKDAWELATIIVIQILAAIIGSIGMFYMVQGLFGHEQCVGNSFGAATPTIKSIAFTTEAIDFRNVGPSFLDTTWAAIGFSFLQGVINATSIVVIFILTRRSDKLARNDFEQIAYRLVILAVMYSITAIPSSNTTNGVRLFAPALVTQILGTNNLLITNIIYLVIEAIGYVFVFYFDEIFKRGEK